MSMINNIIQAEDISVDGLQLFNQITTYMLMEATISEKAILSKENAKLACKEFRDNANPSEFASWNHMPDRIVVILVKIFKN